MVQEKQLRELFKYIEQNWDVCVSQIDKTDIKRIFGGVLCEDIMNDTLHEVKAEPEELKGNCSTFDMSRLVDQPQPALNHIAEAYERGEKIRCIKWSKDEWIKKHSESQAITNLGDIFVIVNLINTLEYFTTHPEKWELYKEPTEQPAPFDKERFEAMFRAVVASGRTERWEQDFKFTEEALAKLDAYYATKEGGEHE